MAKSTNKKRNAVERKKPESALEDLGGGLLIETERDEAPTAAPAALEAATTAQTPAPQVEWSDLSENLDFFEAGDEKTLEADENADLGMNTGTGAGAGMHMDLEAGTDDTDTDTDTGNEIAAHMQTDADSVADSDVDARVAAPEQEVAEVADDADEAGEATLFIENDHLISIVESLLFSTDKPVSVSTIKQLFKGTNIRTKDISRALDVLASEYASPLRGVTLEEISGGFQLRTKADNAEFLRRLAKVRPFRLSGPALEVMSIVAYKQPITKHEIDEIRGVESGHLLRALMERNLVNFGGKSDLPGKPMTYGSTRKFLEIFGLRNIQELPTLGEIDELLPQGIGEVEEKESLSELTDRMSSGLGSTYSEGEDELLAINDDLKEIDTTSEFFEQEKVREKERREKDKARDLRERLMVGEAVDEKDRRWLDRYETRALAAEAAAQAGTTLIVPADSMDEAPEISEQLEGLSAQSPVETSEDDGDSDGDGDVGEVESEEELFQGDDLHGNADWDEERESERD